MLSTRALILVLFTLLYLAHHARKPKDDSINPVNPTNSHIVIEAKRLPNVQTHLQNKLNPPQSRALSNHPRLPAVFGINNAFTSDGEKHVKSLVNHANGLVNLKQGDWVDLAGILRRAVQSSLNFGSDSKSRASSVHLMNLIQDLTMRVVLCVLFRIDEEKVLDIPDEYLINLASAINNAWIQSKTVKCHDDNNNSKVPRFKENKHLQSCLAAIFPHMTIEAGEHNPLNLILPGFEAMWRVVLRASIEIGYTTGLENPGWKEILVVFARAPTRGHVIQQSPGIQ